MSEISGNINEIIRTLSMLKSINLSGEQYSEQCEIRYKDAIGSLLLIGAIIKDDIGVIANLRQQVRTTEIALERVITLLREGMDSTGTGTLHYHKMRETVELLNGLAHPPCQR